MINAYKDLYEKYNKVKNFLSNKIEDSNDFLESIKRVQRRKGPKSFIGFLKVNIVDIF